MIDLEGMTRKYGALDLAVVGSHTEREWLDLLARWNWLCFYCAEPIQRNAANPNREATKDHMIPISTGGVDFIGNIVPACRRCNTLKGNKTVDEFRAQRAWVIRQKSTGDIRCDARPSAEPLIRFVASSETVDIVRPAPALSTLEIATMWKRVVDAAAAEKAMGDPRQPTWWQQRREMLKTQADRIRQARPENAGNRARLENYGQLSLPIFGDGSARKLAETETSAMTLKGMHVVEKKA